jgi:hypothetical protein
MTKLPFKDKLLFRRSLDFCFLKHNKMTKLPLKQDFLNMHLGAFLYFHAGLLVIIKLTKGIFSILQV